jgi:flagellar motility protein MotE (MotC chaperone)
MIKMRKRMELGRAAVLRWYMSVIVVLAILVFAIIMFGDPSGIMSASFAQSQKDEESSAVAAASSTATGRDGTESIVDLVEDRPVTKEVRRALRERELEIASREKEAVRRERELEALRRAIETKLEQLARERANLEELTREIDADREQELDAAVKIYKSMQAADSAQFFNQMDLELVVAVLRRLSAIQAGEVLKEMRTDIQAKYPGPAMEAERQKALERLKKIGETIVDSTASTK